MGVACRQHITDTPYGPWVNIWRDFFGLRPSMDAQSQADVVARRTEALVPDCGDDVSLWGEVLGLPFAVSPGMGSADGTSAPNPFFALTRRCFQAAAREQPLLIVVGRRALGGPIQPGFAG
ncbi:MAG: hypothetical protein IPK53_19390 [bacterium]|nr:hypothetical protein [bacterium]